jgi:recombination protein RecT
MAEETTQLAVLKNYLSKDDMKQRFKDILGERSGSYMASIINVMANSTALKKCDAVSVMNAALISATLDLPIDPNLGFAALVPYGDKAQYQLMTKGFIQLAMRSGQYLEMNVSEVYADEIKAYNPITGEMTFNDFAQCTMRELGDMTGIVGYHAYFKLVNGFHKSLYMTVKQIDLHAKKYSQTYKKGFGNWVDQKDAMSRKTVIKLLLSKWGILSVQMQKGLEFDQSVVKDDGTPDYADHETVHVAISSLDDAIEAEATDVKAD